VGLVAGGLPVSIAIPMVMGANMGTTITNTIVSLGHVRREEEFRRAFAAATVHDFFNLFSIVIFLPLEIMFGFLRKIGEYLVGFILGGDSISMKGFNFIKPLVKPPVAMLKDTFAGLGLSDMIAGIVLIVLGIAMIFFVIIYIGKMPCSHSRLPWFICPTMCSAWLLSMVCRSCGSFPYARPKDWLPWQHGGSSM